MDGNKGELFMKNQRILTIAVIFAFVFLCFGVVFAQDHHHHDSNAGGNSGSSHFHGGAGGWNNFPVHSAAPCPSHGFVSRPSMPSYRGRQQYYYPNNYFYGSPSYDISSANISYMNDIPSFGTQSPSSKSSSTESSIRPLLIITPQAPQVYEVTGIAAPGYDFIFVKFRQNGQIVAQKIYFNIDTKMYPNGTFVQLNDRVMVKYIRTGEDCTAISIRK
jgi:hypothetical protein